MTERVAAQVRRRRLALSRPAGAATALAGRAGAPGRALRDLLQQDEDLRHAISEAPERDGDLEEAARLQYDHAACVQQAATPRRRASGPSRPGESRCCVSSEEGEHRRCGGRWTGIPECSGCWPAAPRNCLSLRKNRGVAERVIASPRRWAGGGIDPGPGRHGRIRAAVGSFPLPRPHRRPARPNSPRPWRRRCSMRRSPGALDNERNSWRNAVAGLLGALRATWLRGRRPSSPRADPAPLYAVLLLDEVEKATRGVSP